MTSNKLREEVAGILRAEGCDPFSTKVADAILALPEIAEAINLRNAVLASQMPDLPPERVGEIMRELNSRTPA